jgi:hypothetical protein
MVLTLTGPGRLEARGLVSPAYESESGIRLDAIVLPWDEAEAPLPPLPRP